MAGATRRRRMEKRKKSSGNTKCTDDACSVYILPLSWVVVEKVLSESLDTFVLPPCFPCPEATSIVDEYIDPSLVLPDIVDKLANRVLGSDVTDYGNFEFSLSEDVQGRTPVLCCLLKVVPTARGNVNLCAIVGKGLSKYESNARAPACDTEYSKTQEARIALFDAFTD